MSPVNSKYVERVACYIRVSHQEQKLHGISLDAQRDKLKEYAEKHGLKIVAWYEDEGVSGRKLIKNRPDLQRMLKDAQAGKFDRIIFIKLDRFFRSVAEYHECMKIIDPVIWTATEEKYDLSTANGRAFVNMKLTIAELEADQTGERIKIVNEYKVKTGQALTGAQNQGIAFTVAKDENGVKRVVKRPETKELVMDYVNHFLTYHNKSQAHAYVQQKYNTNIYFECVGRVLKDTRMYGHYRGNDNYCEPYIDKETFDKIQVILSKNIKNAPSKNIYIFTGLILCPKCGCRLAGSKSGHERPIVNYRCNNYVTHHVCTFNHRPNEKKIEKKLLENFDEYIDSYIKVSEIEDKRVQDMHASDKIKDIKAEMERTTKAYRKGRIKEADYDKEYEELENRLKELESHLEPILERDLSMYAELLESDWQSLYNALTRENKRAFWRKYIKNITLNDNGTVNRVNFF